MVPQVIVRDKRSRNRVSNLALKRSGKIELTEAQKQKLQLIEDVRIFVRRITSFAFFEDHEYCKLVSKLEMIMKYRDDDRMLRDFRTCLATYIGGDTRVSLPILMSRADKKARSLMSI